MKKTLLIAILLMSVVFCNAQSAGPSEPEMIAYATPSKDTLFVQNDDGGKEIIKVWDAYTGPKPVIVVTTNLVAIADRYKQKGTKPKKKKK